MAKPDSGRITMMILVLTVCFFLLKYVVKEAARNVAMNEYFLLILVIGNILQMLFFYGRSNDKLRKEKANEVCYQLYIPPLYPLVIISGVLGSFCIGYITYLNAPAISTEAGLWLFFLSVFFFVPCFFTGYRIISHRKYFCKVNEEAFTYHQGSAEIKILFKDIDWVDYITKRMDMRRGYQKIGVVFKLLNGKEIEWNTWRYGFGEDDVTNLMRDIRTKSTGSTLSE
jgi:hypothetical protein